MLFASVALSGAMMLYLRDHPERLQRVLSSARIRELVDHDFADYYRDHPARSFALQVWTNNALVAAMAPAASPTPRTASPSS